MGRDELDSDRTNIIWKFPFRIADRITIEMPLGARILSAGQPIKPSEGDLCVWALVDPHAPKRTRILRIFGTGHAMSQTDACLLHHIGTVTVGAFVWHLFDGGDADKKGGSDGK